MSHYSQGTHADSTTHRIIYLDGRPVAMAYNAGDDREVVEAMLQEPVSLGLLLRTLWSAERSLAEAVIDERVPSYLQDAVREVLGEAP